MLNAFNETIRIDNGGRRSGIERRQFLYSSYVPERRLGGDRRAVSDRRKQNQCFKGRDRRF